MTLITHSVYRIVVLNHRQISLSWKHHAFCWGVPAILAFLSLLVHFDFGALKDIGALKESSKPVENDRVFVEILTLPCSYTTTSSSSPEMAILAHLPVFFIFSLWIYICVLTMIFEIVIIFWRANQLQMGDIRLEIFKYALYPMGLFKVK